MRRSRWIPAAIALAVLLTIGFVVGAGGDLTHPAPTSLAGSDVAEQLALSIQAERGLGSPPQIRCPHEEPVEPNLRFRCSEPGGAVIYVVETDSRGHLHWSFTGYPPAS